MPLHSELAGLEVREVKEIEVGNEHHGAHDQRGEHHESHDDGVQLDSISIRLPVAGDEYGEIDQEAPSHEVNPLVIWVEALVLVGCVSEGPLPEGERELTLVLLMIRDCSVGGGRTVRPDDAERVGGEKIFVTSIA